MPYTFNGCGTKYYGRREIEPDGSFVTTEWITFVYLPLIPIGSFRVKPIGNSLNILVYRSTEYLVTRVPFNWRQVLNVYLVTAGCFAGLQVGLFLLSKTLPEKLPANSTPSQLSSPNPRN